MDSIRSKVKRYSQYQLEEVQDWAAHLEYFQSILLEFDSAGVPKKPYLIHFFGKASSLLLGPRESSGVLS